MRGLCLVWRVVLNATVRHHVEQHADLMPAVADKLLQSIYVDDVICGANEEEAWQLYCRFRDLLKGGGFNLRKYQTNGTSSESVNSVDQDESYAKATLGVSHSVHQTEQKVLGVTWDIGVDVLRLELSEVGEKAILLEPTKRNTIRSVGQVYDPLGLAAPVTIKMKMLLQDLYRAKLGWDQPLEGELLAQWNQLTESLRRCKSISVPRYYFARGEGSVKEIRLCGFCDASKAAYAAVVYLRFKSELHFMSSIVASKTRVTPLAEHTIPRLELLSALLLARLITTIHESLRVCLNLEADVCYTDSNVALCWIHGMNKDWKPFVQHRVDEIRRLVPAAQWRHCPGKGNPADIPSRGLLLEELVDNSLWFSGPDWLCQQEVLSYKPPLSEEMSEDSIAELRIHPRKADFCNNLSEVRSASLHVRANAVRLNEVIDIGRFSNLDRLLQVTTYVLKFLHGLGRFKEDNAPLLQAEMLWIRKAQSSLQDHRNFKEWRQQLGLFQDESEVWRCKGRISNANVSYDCKHPILLPANDPYTILVIKKAHERVLHNWVKETLTEVRSRYWIVRGRSAIKQILGRCVICRRFEGQHYGAPPPPPLPGFRVTEEPPFTFTGLDYAGPLYIKSSGNMEKIWICLYTCCVTRCIHLDIVFNLSVESFFRSLKRFTARRGVPLKILSDNGKTFKAAARILKRIASHGDISRYLSEIKTVWLFNVERAPWWGGVFERMVKSVKRCLRKVMGQAKLDYDELNTAIIEIEGILNSRPLSYISPDDFDEPLTPSHLMVGRRLMSLPDHSHKESDEEYSPQATKDHLSKRFKHLNASLDIFWQRWRSEYLLELREHHRFNDKSARGQVISVGDIVVVHTNERRRGFWSLGKIEEVFPGRDGQIRAASVHVYTGRKQPIILRRPVQRLYPLEINCSPSDSSDIPSETEDQSTPIVTSPPPNRADGTPLRPRRSAAVRAQDSIMAQGFY